MFHSHQDYFEQQNGHQKRDHKLNYSNKLEPSRPGQLQERPIEFGPFFLFLFLFFFKFSFFFWLISFRRRTRRGRTTRKSDPKEFNNCKKDQKPQKKVRKPQSQHLDTLQFHPRKEKRERKTFSRRVF